MKSIYLLLGLFLLSCTTQSQQSPAEDIPKTKRQQLREKLREGKEILLIYPSGKTVYSNLLEKITESSRYYKVRSVTDKEISEQDLKENIVFILGTPSTNSAFQYYLDKQPFLLEEHQFSFDKTTFSKKGDIARLQNYPNPLNPELPFSFIVGQDDATIAAYLRSKYQTNFRGILWSGWGYEIVQEGKTVMLGNFDSNTYEIDYNSQFNFTEKTTVLGSSEHFDFHGHNLKLSKEVTAKLIETCESNFQKAHTFLGSKKQFPKIQYHLYGSSELKGLMTGNTAHGHIDKQRNEVHTVFGGVFEDNFIDKEYKLLIEQHMGESSSTFIKEGLAVYFTTQWQKKGWKYWAKRLVESGNVISLNDLGDNKYYETGSNLIQPCLSASFVDFLISKKGKAYVLKEAYTKKWTNEELNDLESDWLAFCKNYETETQARTEIDKPLPYQKGFNFAHEGYQIYNGYGSRKAHESVMRLKQLGANSISIVPYSYMRDVHRPSLIPLIQSAGSENDESTVSSAYFAKQQGIFTLLKPQIWIGRDSWTGEIEMKNDKDWKAFYNYYYRWIRHYAMLAEIHEIDALCVGVEMGKATVGHEDEWRKIFTLLRGIYSGPMTFAANWGEEFEQVSFWDDLDFIGLNCYYPLSKNSKVSKRELKKGFEAVKKKIEKVQSKYKKPLVFTEIGFRSVNGTWIQPHEEAGDKGSNEADQKLCYEVIFEGIEKEDWCYGIYWWKWPSDINDSRKGERRFTPYGTMSMETVGKYFGGE